jgi:hypothetical protein
LKSRLYSNPVTAHARMVAAIVTAAAKASVGGSRE